MIFNTFSTFDITIKTELFILSIVYIYLVSTSHNQPLWPTISSRSAIQIKLTGIITTLTKTSKAKLISGTNITFQPIMALILFLNIGSILPYAPSLTAHLVIDISLCLPLWFRIIIWSIIFPQPSVAHYLPEGTINNIAPFLSLVEGVRSFIRPLTLSFRLAANIRAGHVIIAIAGVSTRVVLLVNTKIRPLLILTGGGYFSFELAICFAQAFVLTLLGIIYMNDYLTPPPKCEISLN